jgi:rhodanese-related sulfurtransferase
MQVAHLHPTDAQSLLQADPKAVLLDVREPWELLAARVPVAPAQALHVAMATVPLRLAEIPRSQPVVCICHHGARSAQVVAYLQRQGYEQVYNLAGGIEAWSTHVDPAVPRY